MPLGLSGGGSGGPRRGPGGPPPEPHQTVLGGRSGGPRRAPRELRGRSLCTGLPDASSGVMCDTQTLKIKKTKKLKNPQLRVPYSPRRGTAWFVQLWNLSMFCVFLIFRNGGVGFWIDGPPRGPLWAPSRASIGILQGTIGTGSTLITLGSETHLVHGADSTVPLCHGYPSGRALRSSLPRNGKKRSIFIILGGVHNTPLRLSGGSLKRP